MAQDATQIARDNPGMGRSNLRPLRHASALEAQLGLPGHEEPSSHLNRFDPRSRRASARAQNPCRFGRKTPALYAGTDRVVGLGSYIPADDGPGNLKGRAQCEDVVGQIRIVDAEDERHRHNCRPQD